MEEVIVGNYKLEFYKDLVSGINSCRVCNKPIENNKWVIVLFRKDKSILDKYHLRCIAHVDCFLAQGQVDIKRASHQIEYANKLGEAVGEFIQKHSSDFVLEKL